MTNSNDSIAENQFFISDVGADIVQRIFDTENILQYIFKFVAEIVVRFFRSVNLFMHAEEFINIIQRQNAFGKSGEHQVGNLITVILLLNGICNQPFLHIVADHRACDAEVVEGFQILLNIFCCLFQVKAHVWNFVITGRLEADNGICDAVFIFFSRSFILQRK